MFIGLLPTFLQLSIVFVLESMPHFETTSFLSKCGAPANMLVAVSACTVLTFAFVFDSLLVEAAARGKRIVGGLLRRVPRAPPLWVIPDTTVLSKGLTHTMAAALLHVL